MLKENTFKMKIEIIVGFDPKESKNGDASRFDSWVNFLSSNKIKANINIIASNATSIYYYSNKSKVLSFKTYNFTRNSKGFKSQALRHLKSIALGIPPWITSLHSRELQNYVYKKSLEGSTFIFLGESAGQYILKNSKGINIWDKSNVLTFSIISELRDSKNIFEKLKYLYHYLLARRFENRSIKRVKILLATSEIEIEKIHSISPKSTALLLKSAALEFAPIEIDLRSKILVWIGSFSYGPNWRGLIRFLVASDVFLSENEFRIKLIGSNCTNEQKAFLNQFQSIELVGYVEKIEDYLKGVKAIIVPLWSGAGVKLKCVDALRCGIPIISTSLGMEGISVEAAIGISDSPLELAKIAVNAQPEYIREVQTIAKRIYLDEFSQSAFNKKLSNIVGYYLHL